jgi:hypothetical protein
MRFKFRNYFYQNEESGAEPTDGVSSGSVTDEVKAAAKPEEDDTVKRTLKKLREEAEAANKRAKQLEDRLKERERLDEEEKAKRTGDFETWKERIRAETAAQIEAERKARADEVSATTKDSEELKQEWKHEKIVSAFSKFLKPEFAERFAKIEDYNKLVEVTRSDNGRYSVVVVESLTDRTPRFKSDGKKTVPFTLDDLADQIANEIPTAAKPLNRASGDNIPNGSGKRQMSDFNRTADPLDLIKKSLLG